MSNKYCRILLLISVLLVTRPASVQGTVSLAPSTTIPVLSTYTYLADGTKYKIIDAAGNGRSYIGPFCLAIEKSGSGSSAETKAYLESIEKDGGRIVAIEEETGSGTNSQRSTSYTTLFFIRDHLGSIRAVTDAQGHILERNAYYPFGLQTNQNLAFPTITTSLATLYPNYITSLPARRDLYNGKEIQTAAGTDYLDYGFRQYDPTTARWFNIDPMAEKYSSLTPYNYCAESPIIIIDYNGADTVFMNSGGEEYKRIASNSNVTFVKDLNAKIVQYKNLSGNNHIGWIEAKMPGVIYLIEENVSLSDEIYQKYDYLIAAEVSYFNQLKNKGITPSHTNGQFVKDPSTVPDLDPRIVKAIIMKESRVGTAKVRGSNNPKEDIMQVNVWYHEKSNDWNESKVQFGLKKGNGASPQLSVHAGIGILYQKGLISNGKTTTFTNWHRAIKRYNGGGTANYYMDILKYINNMQ